jgi:hypothetical protein
LNLTWPFDIHPYILWYILTQLNTSTHFLGLDNTPDATPGLLRPLGRLSICYSAQDYCQSSYYSTCLLDSASRLRPTLIAPSVITHNVIPFKTTYSHSNSRYHHRHYIIHTLQDYCSSKYYIPYLSVLNHKTLHFSNLYLPIAILLLSITLGVCLIALNLNY